MPTLRVELLKSREEDVIVEKRVVHSSRVKLVAGHSQHASKSKRSTPMEPAKPTKERVSMGKALGITKKLGARDVNEALLTSFNAHTSHSPSESDSFSIPSSSSSCQSEADSIKKPSPPPASLMKQQSTASLHVNLGSYLGVRWDAHHTPPSDLSKAVHEKFHEKKSPQNVFLEFKFAKGRMVDSHPPARKATNHVHAKSPKSACNMQHEFLNMEASGVTTPTLYSASSRSPKTAETSYHFGDTCHVCVLGHEHKQTQSIKELMAECPHTSHEEVGVVYVEECEHCQMETDDQTCKGYNAAPSCILHATNRELSQHPFEADVGIDNNAEMEKKRTYPRTVSCHLPQGKHEEVFSFETSPCLGAQMQKTTSCRHSSVKESTHPWVLSVQGLPASAKACMEKYVFSTPPTEGDKHGTPSHEERGHMLHVHEKPTLPKDAMATPPVREIKCKANFDELTPISPHSLSEASTLEMYDDDGGRDYFDIAWLATSQTQAPLSSHTLKAQWEWRSKSIGARASLKSAVRNLEAAFGGWRSVSQPKTRGQTGEKHRKSESSKFIDRVFVSPIKNRHKPSEESKPSARRLSYSGSQAPDSRKRNGISKRREAHCNDNGWESASSDYCFVRPSLPQPPLNKHRQKSDMLDLKVSTIPFLPPSRSLHSLPLLKDLPGHASPLISTPPGSALRHLTLPASCMLQGYLQCFERDGKTCYTLSLKDSDEMLLAKACTPVHNLSKEGSKCMYTFQSGRSKSRGKADGWKNWLKKDSKFTTAMAGKMQVSSELSSEVSSAGKRMHFWVSEFVLYDEKNDDAAARSQSLRFLSNDGCRSTCTPVESPLSARSAYEISLPAVVAIKQVPNIPRSPSSARMSSKWASINHHSPLKKETPRHHHSSHSIDVWSDSDVAETEVPREGSYSTLHSELAAIVIKMPTNEDDEDNHELSNTACRRSLKFSEDPSNGPQQDRQDGSKTSDIVTVSETKQGLTNHPTCAPTSGLVTLVLPKERHGLPKDGVHGPTSLINRWKCGGKCDCGGWDLGCGMKVFSTQRCDMPIATSDYGNSIQSIAHKQPLVLYSQGKKQRVLLSLCLVQEGYFILKFHNELPPLRAFAASVAILHSRKSSAAKGRWMPIVKANQQQWQTQCQPKTLGGSCSDRPAFLEVCNDIPTWCPSSSRAPSPYGRA